jgi:hypothetical protein
MVDSVTQILKAGPTGTKINIAVLGDGFAAADQNLYNNKVQELLIDGVFGHDYFYEDRQAFNIFRVNLISADSGVSTRVYDEHGTPDVGSDDTIVSTTIRNTALGYIFSGSWAHCWLEGGANTGTLVANALSTWAPDHQLVVILLNNPNYGGCGGGGFQIVPLGIGWEVLAHEFGHGLGGLADEYCTSNAYAGTEPDAVNVTVNTDRNTLKWRRYVKPATPVPTGKGSCADFNQGVRPADWHDAHSAGLFEGGGARQRASTGRRSIAGCGRIRRFCPVCYTHLKTMNRRRRPSIISSQLPCRRLQRRRQGRRARPRRQLDPDLPLRRGQLDLVFSAVERVPGSWQFQPGDQVLHRRLQRRRQGRGRGLQRQRLGHALSRPARRRRRRRPAADRALRRLDSRGALLAQETTSSTSATSTATARRTCSSSTATTGRSLCRDARLDRHRLPARAAVRRRTCRAGRCGRATSCSSATSAATAETTSGSSTAAIGA